MTKDKRRKKGAESRKLIIDAAISCIAQQGLCDTTLDDVANKAAVSRALVVFHFKSKTQMMSAVLEEISTIYKRNWDQIFSIADSPADKLLKLIAYDVRLPIDKPELVSVWHAFWGDAKGLYKQLNSSRDKKYEQDLNQLINEINLQGNYSHDPKLITAVLTALLLGLWWEAHVNPDTYEFDYSMSMITSILHIHFPSHF